MKIKTIEDTIGKHMEECVVVMRSVACDKNKLQMLIDIRDALDVELGMSIDDLKGSIVAKDFKRLHKSFVDLCS